MQVFRVECARERIEEKIFLLHTCNANVKMYILILFQENFKKAAKLVLKTFPSGFSIPEIREHCHFKIRINGLWWMQSQTKQAV